MDSDRSAIARWLANRRVRTKLLMLVAVPTVVAIFVGGLGLVRLRAEQRAGDAVYTHAMQPALRAAEIKVLILGKRTSALRHASAPDDPDKRLYEGTFRTQAAALDRALPAYPVAPGSADRSRIAELITLTGQYNRILLQEYMPASMRRDAVAVQRARERAGPLGDRSLAVLDQLIAEQDVRAEAIHQDVTRKYQSARTIMIVAMLVSLALVLVLGLYTARLIVRPLVRVQWVAAGLAVGDLTRRSGVAGTDEIARMAQALDQAVDVRRQLESELLERNAELQHISTTDLLTDLANRRCLQQRLSESASLVRRHGGEFSILLLDIDHFKKINDTLGHQAGDLVLSAVADRIRGALRCEDLAGRWGGEEFLVLLPSTGLAGAMILAERIRATIGAHPVSAFDAEPTVTTSIGVASGFGDGVEGLVRRADEALYAAKAAGRDRVVAAPDPTPALAAAPAGAGPN